MIETDRPFMSIVTRACMRPDMLSTNIQSVLSQSCQDIEQIFIVDHTRQGIQVADKALHEYRDQVQGHYVYILDDDCILLNPDFVQSVKGIAEKEWDQDAPSCIRGPCSPPDIVMVKSRRPPGPPSMSSIVPTLAAWGDRRLYHGACNCLCYVMKAPLWREHIEHFGVKPWGGDWWFLKQVLATDPIIYWLDEIVADCRQLGRGRIFETNKSDWFAPIAKEYGLEKITKDIWRLT